MGIVLAFPARPENQKKSVAAQMGLGKLALGEVTIFPGIRVERREFSAEEAARLMPLPKVSRARRRRQTQPEEA